MGFSPPSYTQTPNELFDYWLPKLKLVELRVLMVIFRKTFGWHKSRDRISMSQLEKLTGSHHKSISAATIKLEKLGLIKKEVLGPEGKQQTFYELVVEEDKNSNNSYPPAFTPGNLPRVNTAPQKKENTKENNTPISPKRGLRSLRFEKRKEWAYANQSVGQCGYSEAFEDRYVIISGNVEQIYFYKGRDPFWEKLNL